MLGHAVGIVFGYKFKSLHKFSTAHHFHFLLDGTDNVLELVVEDESSVAVFSVLDDLMGDGGS